MVSVTDLMDDADVTSRDVSALFKVTERTVSYWIRHGLPYYAEERLQLLAGRHQHWRGFKLRAGFIQCSNGDKVTSGQIEMYHWTNRRLLLEVKRNDAVLSKLSRIEKMGTSANEFRASNFVALIKEASNVS